ncbi:MAG: NAD(P)-binding protein [Deltaproteobacteria bacterium]|nr:NAD(P)-binding protein [Deltaproteobacteria bacterium]
MVKKDVNIAGAGIAGLTAAINLARDGRRVRVYERGPDVGTRFNNDFQGLENWSTEKDVLEVLDGYGIKTDFFYKPFKEADIICGERHVIKSPGGRVGVYMVRRGSAEGCLDLALKRQALEAGAEIVFNKKVEEKDVDIVATGPRSFSGVVSGITGEAGWLAGEAIRQSGEAGSQACEAPRADMVMIMLDNDCAPKGYVYMAVIEGNITLASVVMEDFANAKRYFARALEKVRSFYGLDVKNPRPFGGTGNFFLPEAYSKDGNLYVGERAGFQDYLFGFGMRYAFASGYYAAKSIATGSDYEAMVRRFLLPVKKASLVNRFVFERLGGNYKRLVSGWAGAKDPVEFLKRWYGLGLPKRMLYPFAVRWYRKKAGSFKIQS